ncbi:MAG TPA: carbohydrate ABC transporter permease [Gammaproteobacteria bacterium]|nr:carbohydrate ABC transporter permease [Gammaproteobacteria bacterium]
MSGLRALGVYAVLLGLAAVHIAPIVFMVAGSLKPDARVLADMGTTAAFVPAHASLDNYADVFARVDFGRFLLNSILITGSIMLGGLLVNGFLGYALARLRWPGRGMVLAVVLALLILPLEAIAVPLFYQVTVLGWRDTYLVQILPFVANAFFVYLFYVFFLGLPRELEEAARMDGAGVLGTYFRIIVSNARPAFATVAIPTFLFQWGQYLWPLLVTSGERVRSLPEAIAAFRTLPPLQWGDILAFGVMMVAPVVGVFLVFQRWFVRGVAASGLKG